MIRRRRLYRDPYARGDWRTAGGFALGVVALVAVAAGIALGSVLTRSSEPEPAPPPATAFLPDAALPAPAGWVPAVAPPDIPGFPSDRSVARQSPETTVVLTTLPRGPTLLPPLLADRTTGRPETVRRRAVSALRWRLAPGDEDIRTAVLALPTTEATLGLACQGRAWTSVLADCNRALDNLRIRRGRPLPAFEDAPVVQGLIVAVRRLNAGVPDARRALRTAKTDAARAAAAADAARAAEAATLAADVQASDDPEGQDAVNALAALGRGYRELSRGFATDNGRLQRRGVARIRTAERSLTLELAVWRKYVAPPRF